MRQLIIHDSTKNFPAIHDFTQPSNLFNLSDTFKE